jgi:hypothetical protein
MNPKATRYDMKRRNWSPNISIYYFKEKQNEGHKDPKIPTKPCHV